MSPWVFPASFPNRICTGCEFFTWRARAFRVDWRGPHGFVEPNMILTKSDHKKLDTYFLVQKNPKVERTSYQSIGLVWDFGWGVIWVALGLLLRFFNWGPRYQSRTLKCYLRSRQSEWWWHPQTAPAMLCLQGGLAPAIVVNGAVMGPLWMAENKWILHWGEIIVVISPLFKVPSVELDLISNHCHIVEKNSKLTGKLKMFVVEGINEPSLVNLVGWGFGRHCITRLKAKNANSPIVFCSTPTYSFDAPVRFVDLLSKFWIFLAHSSQENTIL